MHNGHFWPILVQKHLSFGQRVAKIDQSEPKLCLMAFQSRVALYMRGYGSRNNRTDTLFQAEIEKEFKSNLSRLYIIGCL